MNIIGAKDGFREANKDDSVLSKFCRSAQGSIALRCCAKMDKAENPRAFSIELDGKRLTPDEIQAIAHSEAYKDRLLAFNERLA